MFLLSIYLCVYECLSLSLSGIYTHVSLYHHDSLTNRFPDCQIAKQTDAMTGKVPGREAVTRETE